MDHRCVLGRDKQCEAGWSVSQLLMTAELNIGGGVYGRYLLLELQVGALLGMQSESGEC